MTNKIMSNRIPTIIIFAYIGFFVLVDISTISKLLILGYGLPRDWGFMGRMALPFVFYFISWKIEGKNKKLALLFFATSRLVYYNSIIFRESISLSVSAICVALVLDICCLYQAVSAYKKYPIWTNSYDKFTSIFVVSVLGVSALLVLLLIYFVKSF
jgi:hypothetical protein